MDIGQQAPGSNFDVLEQAYPRDPTVGTDGPPATLDARSAAVDLPVRIGSRNPPAAALAGGAVPKKIWKRQWFWVAMSVVGGLAAGGASSLRLLTKEAKGKKEVWMRIIVQSVLAAVVVMGLGIILSKLICR